MLVYRFELKFSVLNSSIYPAKNIGPFARYDRRYSTECGYDALHMITLCSDQPEPDEDGIDCVKHGWAYGCHSASELIHFFNRDLGRLHRAGFIAFVYEVPESSVDHGEHQVQYCTDDAKLIDMLDMRELKERARTDEHHTEIRWGTPYSQLGKNKQYDKQQN